MVQRIAFKAVLVNDKNEVLLLRESGARDRSGQGLYQFPGGRLELGEYWQDGLNREMKEETGQEVNILNPIYVGEWRPTIKGVVNQIVGVFVRCTQKDPSAPVVISDEHVGYVWVNKDNWREYDLMRPDDDVLRVFFES